MEIEVKIKNPAKEEKRTLGKKSKSKIDLLRNKFNKISVIISASEIEKEYLNSLREWEKRSKIGNTFLDGKIETMNVKKIIE